MTNSLLTAFKSILTKLIHQGCVDIKYVEFSSSVHYSITIIYCNLLDYNLKTLLENLYIVTKL